MMSKKFKCVLLVLFLGISLSCYQKNLKHTTPENIVIFPPPPDTTRIQFLTYFSNSLDITGTRSGFIRYFLGKDEGKPIIKPYGIAVHKAVIYVCDTILGGLEIIDLNDHTFEYFQPGGKGELKKPVNCFVDQNDFLYVADVARGQIVIFNPELRYVDAFGLAEESKLTDVFIYDNKIWASDIKNRKIHVFNKQTHKLIFSFPNAKYKTPAYLYSPTNLFIINDQVYVSDFGDFKIKIYNVKGDYIRSVGSYGMGHGQLVRPKGIAVDRDMNLFVVDAAFENVQLFGSNGKLLMFFGGSYKGPGYMWLPAQIIIDYDHLQYFQKYVDKSFNLKYLIFVTNQYGPEKISVYGFVEPK